MTRDEKLCLCAMLTGGDTYLPPKGWQRLVRAGCVEPIRHRPRGILGRTFYRLTVKGAQIGARFLHRREPAKRIHRSWRTGQRKVARVTWQEDRYGVLNWSAAP